MFREVNPQRVLEKKCIREHIRAVRLRYTLFQDSNLFRPHVVVMRNDKPTDANPSSRQKRGLTR
jgi:hypothetical protein